ncbi:hypothetical protein CEXT_28461 [Caerostris extrusa]|uniref:Uncharacterized protein n=1 Tax=Caerostris extrusa TaxID=172846 RepID=A0AAV4TIC6_CAEEX|nr:hypothetical protein CEXT_28461 [Caerostris extrusa]
MSNLKTKCGCGFPLPLTAWKSFLATKGKKYVRQKTAPALKLVGIPENCRIRSAVGSDLFRRPTFTGHIPDNICETITKDASILNSKKPSKQYSIKRSRKNRRNKLMCFSTTTVTRSSSNVHSVDEASTA